MRGLGHVALVLGFAGLAAGWNVERGIAQAQMKGAAAVTAVHELASVVAQAQAMGTHNEAQKLALINLFFNQKIVFTDDSVTWGQSDYWASPIESLVQRRGDCEDYAIAKYFGLIAANVSEDRLRLVYVRAALGFVGGTSSPENFDESVQPHMVLAYYATPQSEPLLLDNLVGAIMPASRRPDLTPVFSFNRQGLWQGVQGSAAGEAVTRLSRWREVLAKAAAEGF